MAEACNEQREEGCKRANYIFFGACSRTCSFMMDRGRRSAAILNEARRHDGKDVACKRAASPLKRKNQNTPWLAGRSLKATHPARDRFRVFFF